MRSRLLLVVGIIGLLGIGGLATSGEDVAPQRQWAIVSFTTPTRVGDAILFGRYMVLHDDARMAKGEPCTAIYRFDEQKGPQEVVVAFHCIKGARAVSSTFRVTARHDLTIGTGTTLRLVDYQFAGDSETHAVPTPVR